MKADLEAKISQVAEDEEESPYLSESGANVATPLEHVGPKAGCLHVAGFNRQPVGYLASHDCPATSRSPAS